MHNWRGDSRGSLSVRVFLSGDNKSWQRQEQYIERRGFFKEEEIRRVDGACNSCARANHGRHDGSIIDKPNFFSRRLARQKKGKNLGRQGVLTDCGWHWGFWALERHSERVGQTWMHGVNFTKKYAR